MLPSPNRPMKIKIKVTIFSQQKSNELRLTTAIDKSSPSLVYNLVPIPFLSIVTEFLKVLASLVLVSYKPVSCK